MDGAATLRAVRAALSRHPDRLLIDAASEVGGLDTDSRVREATLEAIEDDAVRRARSMTQGFRG